MSRLLRIAAKAGRRDLIQKLTAQVARLRVREITNQVATSAGLTVQSGPFRGMVLPARTSWLDGDITPKILGCYEAELHAAVDRAAERQPTVVINVGCAEGFYAVGLARLFPHARVYAFDTHERARAVCREAADANGLGERLEIDGACTTQRLLEVAGNNRALIVLDCEGAEFEEDLTLPSGCLKTSAPLRHATV